ncbi:MAG: protein translocase subunit SecD, partial [Dehalococcoidia bacterium]
ISVQLPGIRDMEAAVALIGQTAQLDFRELVRDASGNDEWVPATATDSSGQEVHLTGRYLTRNNLVTIDQTTNEPKVSFEFNDEGANLFGQITGRLIGQPLGIFLDDQLISSPTVRSRIERNGVIENIALEDARELAILLNAGALPVPLGHWERGTFFPGPAVQDEVDPTLGADSIRLSLIAGVVGLIMVLAFMVLYYRLPGVLAGAALLIYGILVLATFKLIPVTLTLAGIAAFVLSIGMAVDANVLIFERLKEELRAGRTLGGAIEAGFSRAWTAIRDSNITTLIICGILYWMGNRFAEPRVMGFAITLAIGVTLSMFTAIVITRTFLRTLVGTRIAGRLWLFGVERSEETAGSKEQG